MDLWKLLEADMALGARVKAGYMAPEERERKVSQMAKVMPSEGGEAVDRTPWIKDDYTVVLKEQELVDNSGSLYYFTPERMQREYGEPAGTNAYGKDFWMVEGQKKYASFAEDAKQYKLIYEVLDGEYEGRWIFDYVSPRVYPKGEGGWGGKLAAIYESAIPGFPMHEGYEDDLSELRGKPFRVYAEPKPKDATRAKVTDYAPLKKGQRVSVPNAAPEAVSEPDVPAENLDDKEDIPF